MKCQTLIITLTSGDKEIISGVQKLNRGEEGISVITDTDFFWYDNQVVAHYKALGYEVESRIQ